MRYAKSSHFFAALGATLFAFLSTSVQAAEAKGFLVTSSAFKDGGRMPVVVNAKMPARCGGGDTSPQLSWSNPPEGTKSFAVVTIGEEGLNGLSEALLVAYGIPADVNSFAEGEFSRASDKYIGGKNVHGVSTYDGPCPRPEEVHHYVFKVIATDLDPKALAPGLSLPELLDKLKGHAKGGASLVGVGTAMAN